MQRHGSWFTSIHPADILLWGALCVPLPALLLFDPTAEDGIGLTFLVGPYLTHTRFKPGARAGSVNFLVLWVLPLPVPRFLSVLRLASEESTMNLLSKSRRGSVRPRMIGHREWSNKRLHPTAAASGAR